MNGEWWTPPLPTWISRGVPPVKRGPYETIGLTIFQCRPLHTQMGLHGHGKGSSCRSLQAAC